MTREELHIQTSELIKTNKRIALQWCTGLGKSRASIEMANYIQSKGEDNIKILLVVAESAHKDNWAKEMLKWKLLSNDVTVECYASLPKYKETWWDLIIFDEAHHRLSPENYHRHRLVHETYQFHHNLQIYDCK